MNSEDHQKRPIYIHYSGQSLLETSLLNKDCAFSQEERQTFNLQGLLPEVVETIEQQVERAYQQFSQFNNDLDKHIYLRNIQDANETLYFRLIITYLPEMMPVIYTPTVGLACQLFSRIYRRKRGIFIAYPERDQIDDILQNVTKQKIKIIVVTDSERILGLGDQGIGGMGIPIGKLALYSACGGISPAYTLPVTLDVGTNNQQLLSDPLYMGWRHERITGDEYYRFIDQFIAGVKRRWPHAMIQFEDFAQHHATPLLQKYRQNICTFNDDIQGTAAVAVGTLLAACRVQKKALKDQTIVFVGAGSAGCGIAEQIIAHMQLEGVSEQQALDRIFLCNSQGLLLEGNERIQDFQEKFAKPVTILDDWGMSSPKVDLLDTVKGAKPSIIIGVSGQPGMITQEMIEFIYQHCSRPIVLPLSNPTSRVEVLPEDVINWTEGNAIVATGSPFQPVVFEGQSYAIAQCNNSYIFPGVGLGVVACAAEYVTDNMFMAASKALADCSPWVLGDSQDLLPALKDIRKLSRTIAFAVGMQAMEDKVAKKISAEELKQAIAENFWFPEYRQYRRTSI